MEIFHPRIPRHVSRQHTAHGNQWGGMRHDKHSFRGPLFGPLPSLDNGDFRIQIGDYTLQCRGDAVVKLGDRLALRGGEEMRGVRLFRVWVGEQGREVVAQG